MEDRYGLPLSTKSPTAAAAYGCAMDGLLAAGSELVPGFEAALALDDGFALAEIGRARCLATYGYAALAKASAVRARTLAVGTTRREQSHVEALALVVEGRGAEALPAIRQHVAEFPRDALVLQPATGIFGLIGFSGRLEREAEFLALMDGLAVHYGDDWWFNSIRAFSEVEGGRVADAERRVERSLEQMPHNGNAAHVRAHVFYELEQPEAGAEFLRRWLASNSTMGLLRGHLSWHLALWELGLGDAAAAWRLYDQEFGAPLVGRGPPTPPLNVLTDAASWLWRAELVGEERRDQEWERLAQLVDERYPRAGIPFADIHVAMVRARTGQVDAIATLRAELATLGQARPACLTAATVAQGLAAFSKGDDEAAVPLLTQALPENVRVGGSHAQRDVVDRTLLQALNRLGRTEAATAILASRPHLQHGS